MLTIGIRAEPSAVTFAIYDASNKIIINVEQIIVPKAFEIPDALKYVRSHLLDVLREYSVVRAGIRTTEPSAQRPNIARIQIEGTIQEAFASSTLDYYYNGQISSMAAKLGLARANLKPIIKGANYFNIDQWADHSEVEREAILCAMGAAANA